MKVTGSRFAKSVQRKGATVHAAPRFRKSSRLDNLSGLVNGREGADLLINRSHHENTKNRLDNRIE
jgi:hypothetical protein